LHDRFGNSDGNGALKLLGVHVVADKTEETRSQTAETPFRAEFLQTFDRKDHVDGEVCIVVMGISSDE
jgi:hypothetical protein